MNKLSKCKKLRNLQVEKGYTFSIKDGGKFTDLTVKEVAIASNLNYSTVYYNIQFLALELADFLIEKLKEKEKGRKRKKKEREKRKRKKLILERGTGRKEGEGGEESMKRNSEQTVNTTI